MCDMLSPNIKRPGRNILVPGRNDVHLTERELYIRRKFRNFTEQKRFYQREVD